MERYKKILITLISVLSLAVLLYPGVKGLQELNSINLDEPQNIINGTYVDQLRSEFEDNISIKSQAVSFWSAIKYRIFKEGSPGVLIGRDDWLYTTEELDSTLVNDMDAEEFYSRISDYNTILKNEDISLYILLVPSKSRIYREKLKQYDSPENIADRYDSALKKLQNEGIAYIDLRNSFEEQKKNNQIFYKYDTHWTSEGTMVAAESVLETIGSDLVDSGLSQRKFSISEEESHEFMGDLLAFVPDLEKSVEKKKIQEEYRELILIDENPPILGLFDDPVIPIILTGTSYSKNSKWNFEEALKLTLQTDVLNLSEEGKGPMVPMDDLMESAYYRETGSSIILWEIPERYIPLR